MQNRNATSHYFAQDAINLTSNSISGYYCAVILWVVSTAVTLPTEMGALNSLKHSLLPWNQCSMNDGKQILCSLIPPNYILYAVVEFMSMPSVYAHGMTQKNWLENELFSSSCNDFKLSNVGRLYNQKLKGNILMFDGKNTRKSQSIECVYYCALIYHYSRICQRDDNYSCFISSTLIRILCNYHRYLLAIRNPFIRYSENKS